MSTTDPSAAPVDRCCSKCGGSDVLLRWHKGEGRYGRGGCGFNAQVVCYSEHIHVTCRTCQYEWTEDTLDNLG